MLRKDLKVGVVYINRNQKVKATIVSLDQAFEKPPGNINESEAIVAQSAKGSKAAYVVLSAGLGYPDEQLIEEAKTLSLPVAGEVWPYAVITSVRYNYRLLPKKFHDYPVPQFKGVELHQFGGYQRMHMPKVGIWVPQEFGQEYAGWAERKTEAQKKVEAEREAARVERQRIEAQGRTLVNRINALGLEDVNINLVEARSWGGESAILLSADVAEALLKKIGG